MESGDVCSGDSRSARCQRLQQSEIETIKQIYGDQAKVISGIGEFTNVVTIHPEGLDLHCKFQLTEMYPYTLPTISIRSSVLGAEQTTSLIGHLENEAASKRGHEMLEFLLLSCQQWLKDIDIDFTETVAVETAKEKKRKGKSKTKREKTKPENEEDRFAKKPPMKTAADVIKRLQWDEAFNKEDFIVGYMDRIKGLLEKNFTAFTWEDLASVDIYSLAIPQHRIQYFKYKSEKVWDKNERLDNVFGSTGSNTSLGEAVQKFDEKQRELEDVCEEDGNRASTSPLTKEATISEEADAVSMDNNPKVINVVEDSSTENKVEGQCAGMTSVSSDQEKECQKLSTGVVTNGKSSQSAVSLDATPSSKTDKSERRFNFFVALQITDKRIVKKFAAAQDTIIDRYPQYAEFRSPPNGFHLTLAVLKLDTDSEKQACVEVMKAHAKEFAQLAKAIKPLKFIGLGSFTSKVIFAKIIHTRVFLDLVELIRQRLKQAGFRTESKRFYPHLTMFNVKNSAFADSKWKNFRLTMPSFSDVNFGSQPIDNIQLCRMGTLPKDEGSDQFYENIFKMDIY